MATTETKTVQPNPKAFPTEGPRSMQFTAYDPNRFDVCADSDCLCRSARGNIRGFGATEEEALADFWLQWGDSEPTLCESMGRLNAVLEDALSRLGDTPASEAEERNERARISHYEAVEND